jgi:hypothetical protein
MYKVENQQGSVSLILAVVFGVLFLSMSIFGIWAFTERQSYKNDVEAKIEAANEIAVEKAETAKDVEFVEKEKLPTKTYTGSSTYGGLSFAYPKTWSVYSEESSNGDVINVYAHPNVVPGIKSEQPYALRAVITSTSYESEVQKLQKSIEAGVLTSVAYRPVNVQSILGVKVDGEIDNDIKGSVVLLPLRDRTIKIYTESQEFLNDLNNIILPSLSFSP